MRFFSYLLLFVCLGNMSVFSQEKVTKHTVSKGETISEIADKYNIKPSAIYALNPKAKKGIKPHAVLLIPTESKKKLTSNTAIATNITENSHEILAKETLYGIAKQYKVSVKDLYEINSNLEKEGLKQGEKINIPSTETNNLASESTSVNEIQKKNTPDKVVSNKEVVVLTKSTEKIEIPNEGILHEVSSKETLFSIAMQYGIKLSDLQKANSNLGNKPLAVGQKINIPIKKAVNTSLGLDKKPIQSEKKRNESYQAKQIVVSPKPVLDDNNIEVKTEINHEVLPKESLFSIARKYNISVADLRKSNPALGNKALQVGQKVIILVQSKNNLDIQTTGEVSKIEKEQVENENSKQIAILPQPLLESKRVETIVRHKVLSQETKYGIASQYGITVEELEEQNPKIVKELRVGIKLKIRGFKSVEISEPTQEVALKEQVAQVNSENLLNTAAHDATFVDKLISTASENIGTRYRFGGISKDGFDCSGLMCSTFGALDIKLPRTSIEMSSYGVVIDTENAQKGDLIFFKTRGRQINHVGMVVEVIDGDIKFIHSSVTGGVMISSIKEKYYSDKFVQINHIL